MKKNKKKLQKSRDKMWWYYLPLYMLCFVPLIVIGIRYNTNLEDFVWYPDVEEDIDIFLYGKMIALVLLGMAMLIMCIYSIKKQNAKIGSAKWIIIPFSVYVLFNIISTLISENRFFGMRGMTDSFESVWVVITYLIIITYTCLIYDTDKNKLLLMIVISALIMGIIGALQVVGLDPYRTSVVQNFIMMLYPEFERFEFDAGIGRAYISLANPNYVGVMGTILIPVLVNATFILENKKHKIMSILATELMLLSVVAARSKAGIACIFVQLFFLLILYRKQIYDYLNAKAINKLKALIIIVVSILVMSITVLINFDKYADAINEVSNSYQRTGETGISEISTNDDNVTIKYAGKTIIFYMDADAEYMDDVFTFTDENGMEYGIISLDDGVYSLDDEAFSQIFFEGINYYGTLVTKFTIDEKELMFTNQTEDGTYCYINDYGKADKFNSNEIEITESLIGHEYIVTGRGYIWSRTLPLLKKYILFGCGQDCFALVYPNDDYLGRINFEYENVVNIKPHSMYLQIAVQSGCISLVAYLIFWMVFLISGIKYLKRTKINFNDEKTEKVQHNNLLISGIIISSIGYLVVGISNDSTVATTPVMMLIAGMACGIYKTAHGGHGDGCFVPCSSVSLSHHERDKTSVPMSPAVHLISIIVPVYNVEQYVAECIESIIHQTYRNIEIIIVNDGSTDKSVNICEKYASSDERIKLIHQQNQGLSGARNTGILQAKGDYISFVDSDDVICADYIETLYGLIEKYDADIAACDFFKGSSFKEMPLSAKNKKNDYAIDSAKMLREWHGKRKRFETVAWNKLYSSKVFEKDNEKILFPIGKTHEDVYIVHRMIQNADKVAITPKKLYFYRMRGDSIVNSKPTAESICQDLEAQKSRMQFFYENGFYMSYLRCLKGHVLHRIKYMVVK